MYPALDSALNWSINQLQTSSSGSPHSRFILLTDELSADGSFLIHHFIGRQLKKDVTQSRVLLVGLAQSQDHYLNVGKKLGYNLTTSSRASTFHFLDPLSPTIPVPSHTTDPKASQTFVQSLYKTIATKLLDTRATEGYAISWSLIFDDISLLLYSGIAVQDVLWLVGACRALIINLRGHLVVLSHADVTTTEDVEQTALNRSLGHMSDYMLEVRSLESGVTHGVTGQLSLMKGPLLDDPNFHPQVLHYTITDSCVQFSAKGYSGGVL
ncbi:Elongator subunit elp6 [Rhizophlyctis rosea]|uniref:Elongator subunit elp6 n=1 Tax=Rhizophlyctis rosea TaxID=64517 RepID=A0AAD5S828_9FUNG|nr:Elongator subunit elp6 [Rhizophlyctis rosea]